MSKKITVRIAPDGNVSVETTGYAGRECQQATGDLESALGLKVDDKAKPEMYKQPQVNRNTH